MTTNLVPLQPRAATDSTFNAAALAGGTTRTAGLIRDFVHFPVVKLLQEAGYAAGLGNTRPGLFVARRIDQEAGTTRYRAAFPSFLALPDGWAAEGWEAIAGVPQEIPAEFIDGPLDGLESVMPADSRHVQMPTPRPRFKLDPEDEPAVLTSTLYNLVGFNLANGRWAFSVRSTITREANHG